MHRHGSAVRISRNSTQHEAHTTLVNGRERKRTQVACMRCRKRKIKCNGIGPDGCANCKSHGIPASHCVIKRAGATTVLEMKPATACLPQRQQTSAQASESRGIQYWPDEPRSVSSVQQLDPRDQQSQSYSSAYNGAAAENYTMHGQAMPTYRGEDTYGTPPIHMGMPPNSVYTRQLPERRLPSISMHKTTSAHASGHRPWLGWNPGPTGGYASSSTGRYSISTDLCGDDESLPPGSYATQMSPPSYLLPPAVAPSPFDNSVICGDSVFSRSFPPTQPTVYNYGQYQPMEHDRYRYASLTIN